MGYQFGICEWSLPVSGPLAIRLAGEAGFAGIQLGEAGGRALGFPLTHPRVQAAILEAAEESGVCLHSLNLGALLSEGTLNESPASSRGAAARESLCRGISACRALGIPVMVVTADPATEEAAEHVVTHLRTVSERARDSGVEIALECALPLERIQGLLQRLDDGVKICMDMLNPLRFGTGDPRRQLRTFGPARISHFHMKDSLRSLFRPSQRGCVPLGTGDAGFADSVSAIKAVCASGWVLTENYYYLPPMNDGQADFLALAARDLATLQQAFAF